jgi:Chromo (CHRromatin Organisation MOdifier) domain
MAIHALNKIAHKVDVPPNRWTVGQLVWLEGKNLPLPHGTAKLAPRRHGPFKVTQIISPVAVRLELPPQWNIHPVFHGNLLTPYTETPSHGPNFTRPPPDLIDGEEEYEVEQIRSHRTWGRSKTLQYLIKWKGYPESDNTWENADQTHAPELVKLYHQALTKHGLKARRIRLKKTQPPTFSPPHPSSTTLRNNTAVLVQSPHPLRLRIAHLCSPTTNSFSAVTTAYSLLPNLVGPTITETPARTNRDTTASSAPSRSKTGIASRRTSSTNIPLILRQANDWTKPRHFPRFTTPECTLATFPSFTVKAVDTPPPHSVNYTSTVSFVNSLNDTGVPSVQRHLQPATTLRTIFPTNTSSTHLSYTGSSKWNKFPDPFAIRPNPSRTPVASRNPASTSSRENPSDSSFSGSPTMCLRIMPASTNVSASSTIARSTIKVNISPANSVQCTRASILEGGVMLLALGQRLDLAPM